MNRNPCDYIHHRASLADRIIGFVLLCLFLGYCSWYQAKAAPPMPSDPGAPVKLNHGDVLNPEFPAVPSDPSDWSDKSHEDDAFARATLALAGEPAATPEPTPAEKPGLWRRFKNLWLEPDEDIDPVKTSGAVALGVVGVLGVIEANDQMKDFYRSKDAAPAAAPKPVAAAPGGPASLGDRSTVTVTGEFLGNLRATDCGAFIPSLHFTTGQNGGTIQAYTSSKTCAGGGNVSAGWAADNVNRIVIYCPDEFYNGPATIVIGTRAELVLANGTRLSGGVITIAPEVHAEAVQP